MSQKVIIMGGVGNGTVITQAIIDANRRGFNDLEVVGYFSDRIDPGEMIDDFQVIAKTSRENVELYSKKGYKFIYTIYRIDGQNERLKLFVELGFSELNLVSFIHPTAYVAPNVKIDAGVVVMPYVMISASAHIGMGTLLMTGATVGHNTILGKFNHVASQAVIGAYITTENGVHIGLNSTLRENLIIGENATIGMGSVLTKNVKPNEIWVGNPACFLRMAK